jgi:hypothetical protein
MGKHDGGGEKAALDQPPQSPSLSFFSSLCVRIDCELLVLDPWPSRCTPPYSVTDLAFSHQVWHWP